MKQVNFYSVKEYDFKKVYIQLLDFGVLDKKWFNNTLQHDKYCYPCNFTTLAGIFE